MAFISTDPMNVCIKFEVRISLLLVPKIIRGTHKIGQSLDTPTLHFLQIFNGLLFGLMELNVPAKFEVRSFTPVTEIIAIEVLGGTIVHRRTVITF